jgi:hypothetical protein
VTGRARVLVYFVIAVVAVWEGLTLAPTLEHGYVLIALPALLARATTVVCLGAGGGILLLLFVWRLEPRTARAPRAARAPARDGASARSEPGAG